MATSNALEKLVACPFINGRHNKLLKIVLKEYHLQYTQEGVRYPFSLHPLKEYMVKQEMC